MKQKSNGLNGRIGIVGLGFVGSAVKQGYFQLGVSMINTYDIKNNGNCMSIKELVAKGSRYIFVCVPTPKMNGASYFGEVLKVCKEIDKHGDESTVAIIKSTILPKVATSLQKIMKRITIAVNPEFLTQRTAMRDFLHPKRMIWGCDNKEVLDEISQVLGGNFFNCPQHKMSLELAMKCKYMANCFGFMKVLYFNIMREWIGDQSDYEEALQTVLESGWVNRMHTKVPGPDGKFGAGGACLPKDTYALAESLSDTDIRISNFIKSAYRLNEKFRR